MSFKYIILSSCILFASIAYSQICDGNLGDNIFTEGDFGSGVANILGVDPNIAPGYIYTTDPPPDDGFYTITNDMTQWNFAFGWLEIQDNSADKDGYMMVVNASFTAGLFYEKIIDDLCENTLYVFSADIYNLIDPGTDIIRPNVSFLIDNVEEYNTGDIEETAEWNTYGFTFTTSPGQTSVRLSLRNNAPGGIGNDLALDNISFKACGPEARVSPEEEDDDDETIGCADGSTIELSANIIGTQYDTPVIQWQLSTDEGMTWVDISGETASSYSHNNLMDGIYYYRYLISNNIANLLNSNCRVISNPKIIRVVPLFFGTKDTVCDGLTIDIGRQAITDSGIYKDTLISSNGCDSIVTVELFFIPDPDIQLDISTTDPSCSDLSDGTISIDEISEGQPPYEVDITDADFLTEYIAEFIGEGDYFISVTDKYGCSTDIIVQLTSPNPFTIDIGEDLEIVLGETTTLMAVTDQEISSYNWSANSYNIECNNCETLETIIPTDTYVYLTAISTNGCIYVDSLYASVRKDYLVYLPNIINTSDGNINSQFSVFTKEGNAKLIQGLRIYDRWGNLVYEIQDALPNSEDLKWNGTYDNQILNSGVYSYVISIQFVDDEVFTYIGSILLIPE